MSNYIATVLDNVIIAEFVDYYDWCEANGFNSADYQSNLLHIYANAVLARKELAELERLCQTSLG